MPDCCVSCTELLQPAWGLSLQLTGLPDCCVSYTELLQPAWGLGLQLTGLPDCCVSYTELLVWLNPVCYSLVESRMLQSG